jgi:hypothetical protein
VYRIRPREYRIGLFIFVSAFSEPDACGLTTGAPGPEVSEGRTGSLMSLQSGQQPAMTSCRLTTCAWPSHDLTPRPPKARTCRSSTCCSRSTRTDVVFLAAAALATRSPALTSVDTQPVWVYFALQSNWQNNQSECGCSRSDAYWLCWEVDPFIDPEGYRAFIDAAEAEFRSGRVH